MQKSNRPFLSIRWRINYHTASTLPVISLTLNKILPNTRIIHNLLKCSIIINVNDEINSMEEDFTDFTYLQSSKNASDSILKHFILLLEDLIYFIFVQLNGVYLFIARENDNEQKNRSIDSPTTRTFVKSSLQSFRFDWCFVVIALNYSLANGS